MTAAQTTRASAPEVLQGLTCGNGGCPCQLALKRGSGLTHCPAHQDDKPSLNVTESGATVLVYCHGGCEQNAVLEALRERELWPSTDGQHATPRARRQARELPKVDAIYPYSDADGVVRYRVVRYEGKRFEVWHPNGSGWDRGLGGAELVPYRLPELAAADATKTVFVGEGEKVVDRLVSLGLVATTNPFGALKWPADWGARHMRSRRVAILPDADDVGAKHARAVAESCAGHAASVRIVELADLPEHGDVVDWIAAGHEVAELVQLVEVAPEYRRTPVSRTDLPCTDLGNSERLVARHGADLRYVAATRQWHVWDGRRWRADDTGEIERRAKETARSIYREAEAAGEAARRKELAAHAVKTEAAPKIAAMIALAQSDATIALRADQLDADPWLLNVASGTIDLRSGELRAHRGEDLITKLAPVEYEPEARLELWETFLFQALGADADLIRYVQKAAGYGLCGDTREEVISIVHGPTGGGKTTFAEALRGALGDYAATADPESFLTSRRDGAAPRADIARLHGRRLVVGVEVDQDRHIAEGLVKQLTGGDTVVARHLYREHFEFRPQFKLWIFANDAPRVRDDDDAVWRRIRLIPFVHPVPKEQRDPQVKISLRDPKVGGPAVLTWAVKGCLLWQQEGLGAPPVIESATERYREAMDPVADFLDERCVIEDGAVATFEELFGFYRQWAEAAGERRPLTKRAFSQRLERRGFPPEKGAKGVRIRRGIGLRDQQSLGMTANHEAPDEVEDSKWEMPW